MISYYHQTKTPISFWCRQELNPRSLIQPSETLLIELTGTHALLVVENVECTLFTNIVNIFMM